MMRLKAINNILFIASIILIGNLITVKVFDYVLLEVTASSWSLGENLSISFVTGHLVYYLTYQFPKGRIDKSRIDLVKNEVNYRLNHINVRLGWLGIDKDMSKAEFKTSLEQIEYDKIVSNRGKVNAYECLNQIKDNIEELREIGLPLLMSTERSDLVDEFKKTTLRPSFLNREMKYINKMQEELVGEKLEISQYLYDLIAALKNLESKLK